MADLASTDVTLTIVDRDRTLDRRKINLVQLDFGDGSKKYPAAGTGVPLPALSNFEINATLRRLLIADHPLDGLVYKYDKAHHSLRIFQSAGFTPAGTITNGTPDTFAGTAVAAAPLVELGNVGLAATTLVVEVRGK